MIITIYFTSTYLDILPYMKYTEHSYARCCVDHTILSLADLFWRNINIYFHCFHFRMIRRRKWLKSCLVKNKEPSSHRVNIMAADNMVMQGAMASLSMAFEIVLQEYPYLVSRRVDHVNCYATIFVVHATFLPDVCSLCFKKISCYW